jgi:hypothetical protein
MNRRPKTCCQGCADPNGGVCAAPVGHGAHPYLEDWWSPRSGPTIADLQAVTATTIHQASLFANAARYANAGLHATPARWWKGDQRVADVLPAVSRREARSVPPNQTTLISPRGWPAID